MARSPRWAGPSAGRLHWLADREQQGGNGPSPVGLFIPGTLFHSSELRHIESSEGFNLLLVAESDIIRTYYRRSRGPHLMYKITDTSTGKCVAESLYWRMPAQGAPVAGPRPAPLPRPPLAPPAPLPISPRWSPHWWGGLSSGGGSQHSLGRGSGGGGCPLPTHLPLWGGRGRGGKWGTGGSAAAQPRARWERGTRRGAGGGKRGDGGGPPKRCTGLPPARGGSPGRGPPPRHSHA